MREGRLCRTFGKCDKAEIKLKGKLSLKIYKLKMFNDKENDELISFRGKIN